MISGSEKADARRAERRQEISAQFLAPVEELLHEGGGFTDLTVDEIIQRAGVPRSTFYYNFRDKAELLIAISETAIAEIVEASYGLYRLGPKGTRAEFTKTVRHTADTWLPHVPLMNALAELANYNPRVKEQFLAGWAAARHGIADHIRAGQEAGTVRGDLHPEYTGAWLTWMAERGLGQLVLPAEPGQVDEMVEALAGIVWHTLYGDRG